MPLVFLPVFWRGAAASGGARRVSCCSATDLRASVSLWFPVVNTIAA